MQTKKGSGPGGNPGALGLFYKLMTLPETTGKQAGQRLIPGN
jgi:hypothetical protein